MRQITTLANQIRIVTQQLKDRRSVSVGVWVGAGGRYETKANKGVAHFLEHMAFKGSVKYSCNQIKQLIEGIGGNLNAFTGEEETCYYAKVPTGHLARTFDVLADICFFPKLARKDVEKERTVILEEIKMYRDLPQYYVGELLEELMWPNHPLGQGLAGTLETVGSLSLVDLKNFRRKHYISSNTVISACGDIQHEDFVRMVSQKLAKISSGPKQSYLPVVKTQTKAALNLYHKETEQMHLALGYPAYENNHKDYYASALLSIILGGNMSSRLFNEVREKHGLAYSISSGLKTLDDTGAFMVRAGVDNHKITDALELILKVCGQIMCRPVGRDEFQRAKDYYLGQFLLGLEDTLDQMLWVGGVVISQDKVKTVSDVVKKINAVSQADIRRVAADILNPHKINMAVIGPVNDAQKCQLEHLAGGIA